MSVNLNLEPTETIEINGIQLPVMPTDVSFFADNKLVEEVYIRAKGAITFRSKHTESLLTLSFTFPIIELAVPNLYDATQREIASKGIDLITSLDAYPFCFIKSPRVKSYLGSHNIQHDPIDPSTPEDDVLMFGTKKITLSLDSRAPGLLFLELQLLYNNHRILTPSMKINWDHSDKAKSSIGEGTSPIGFTQFLKNLGHRPRARALAFMSANSERDLLENLSSHDVLSQVRLEMPQVLNLHEMGIDRLASYNEQGQFVKMVLEGNIDKLPPGLNQDTLKFFRMPDPYATGKLMVNLSSVESPEKAEGYETSYEEIDIEEAAEDEASLGVLHAMYWIEDPTAYDQNINTIQSMKLEKERSFASQLIGDYQHPFLQYMGKYPARLNIQSAFDGSQFESSEGFHYLFKLLQNSVDANAVLYPKASAYNYVKVHSIITGLLDCTNFIPHQSEVVASSRTSNMEVFSCVFIENSMDKMKESSQVRIGRKVVNYESTIAMEKLIAEYLTRLEPYMNGTKEFTDKEKSFHLKILHDIQRIYRLMNGDVESFRRTLEEDTLPPAPSEGTKIEVTNDTQAQPQTNTQTSATSSTSSKSFKLSELFTEKSF